MSVYNDQLIDETQEAAKQVVVDAGCEVYEPSADELKALDVYKRQHMQYLRLHL